MDRNTLAAAIAIVKQLPDTAASVATQAKEGAEAAAIRAETAADTVTAATVAETKEYLGI